MEIPKYSEWVKKVSEAPEIEVDAESFKALFSKRDERTPNKQMHNFLKAYAFAVNNARKEDRFPNLDEIEKAFTDVGAPIEGQVVYNLKKRFMKNTQFFEERDFETKGVYLSPKALRFKDCGGRYSDLIFDFDNGAVALPELKLPAVDLHKKLANLAPHVIDETRSGSDYIDNRIEKPKIEPEKPSDINPKEIKKLRTVKFALILIAIVLIALVLLIFAVPDKQALEKKNVIYSIVASNDEEGDFILFELSNPDGVSINSTVALPPSRIIVEVGPVSINQSNNTIIGLNTDKNAKIKMYSSANESVPLVITHNFKGNPIPTVSGINNYRQMITAEKFQWNFEIKNSTSIKIGIEQ